jgi:hypothetical protein
MNRFKRRKAVPNLHQLKGQGNRDADSFPRQNKRAQLFNAVHSELPKM